MTDATGLRRGAELEVTIEKLVYGGDGIARAGAHVVFVPTSAPGDRLRIRVTEARRGFSRGEVVEILARGAARREPRCRHFGACGGCHLQHVAYSAQTDAKAGFVRESLRRLGGIDWAGDIPVRTAAEYGYRTRAEFQARKGHVGFFRGGTHEVLDVTECPILVPAAEAFLLSLRADPPPSALQAAVGDDGTVASRRGETVRRRVAGFDFEFAADTFFQGNAFLADTLVKEAAGDAAGGVALDLYAGCGLFSLPLSRRFREVVAVEGGRAAAAQGGRNAAANGVANVRFVNAQAETFLADASLSPDLVVVDPPRAGLGPDTSRRIAALGAGAVTYVSCDPATLARDLREMLAAGYRLGSIVALDLFPQTYHVETVAKLVR